MMNAKIMTVTPALAKEWLDNCNDNNRKLRDKKVNKYAKDMASGNWELNGEGIQFSENGKLKNGQHRLAAIVKSNKPQTMLIVEGIADDVTTYDRGTNRTVHDILILDGCDEKVADSKCIGIINFFWRRINQNQAPTIAEIKQFIEEHEENLTRTMQIIRRCRGIQSLLISPIPCALFCALESGYDFNMLLEFIEVYRSGLCNYDTQWSALVSRRQISALRENAMKNGLNYKEKLFAIMQEALYDYQRKNVRKKNYPGTHYWYYDNLKAKKGEN